MQRKHTHEDGSVEARHCVDKWVGEERCCAFLSACSRRDFEAVERSVNNAEVDPATAVDTIGQNGLHFVACGDARIRWKNATENPAEDIIKIIELLASKGADVNLSRGLDGCTPLILGAVFNSADCVRTLLKLDADISTREPINQMTAEDWAVKFRHEAVVRVIRERRKLDTT